MFSFFFRPRTQERLSDFCPLNGYSGSQWICTKPSPYEYLLAPTPSRPGKTQTLWEEGEWAASEGMHLIRRRRLPTLSDLRYICVTRGIRHCNRDPVHSLASGTPEALGYMIGLPRCYRPRCSAASMLAWHR
ncbi:hypothetical protein CGRA01v4_11815 [Colletotrichum graminicola]|nr:hypothetical protein CGRA01v4_11815 [Colletotrichum graminicola]